MAKRIVAYEAIDGTTFKTQAEADAHDAKLKSQEKIQNLVSNIMGASQVIGFMSDDDRLTLEGELKAYLSANGPAVVEAFASAPKRSRRTKAEMEAARAAVQAPAEDPAPVPNGQLAQEPAASSNPQPETHAEVAHAVPGSPFQFNSTAVS